MSGSPYRYSPQQRPSEGRPDPYLVGWRSFERRRLYTFLVVPAGLATTALAGVVLGEAGASISMLAWFAIAMWAPLAPCPKCGKYVMKKELYPGLGWSNAFTSKCMNCGIEIGTPRNALGDKPLDR